MDPCLIVANFTATAVVDINSTIPYDCCDHDLATDADCSPSLQPPASNDVDMVAAASACCRHWPVLLLSVLVVAGVTGNSLVCCAVAIERKLRNVTNYFLVSLAVTDLLVSLVVMPACIAHDFIGGF